MNIQDLLHLLVWLAVIGGICWVLWWLAAQFPAPFNTVARLVVAVVAAVLVINYVLLPMLGTPPVIRVR